jgi:hypothetical protein
MEESVFNFFEISEFALFMAVLSRFTQINALIKTGILSTLAVLLSSGRVTLHNGGC